MRYVIKAVKDYGAPYINTRVAPTYRSTIMEASWFTSLHSAINGILEINERGDAGRGELTVVKVEEVMSKPQYREVEL